VSTDWVPVTERLPEDLEDVLVVRVHGKIGDGPVVDMGWWYDGHWWMVGEDFPLSDAAEVTHWMPLPALPESGAPASAAQGEV
jgi:hypothetical protein